MPMLCCGEYIQQCRITRLLGAGGMGAVYEAVDQQTGTPVAVKVLHPECALNRELIARFFNEARAVNQIGHPGTVQIFECGFTSDGTAFLIMEFLRGETLTARLQRAGGILRPEETCALASQIAAVLEASHSKGVIHRDLKPDNVMITMDETGQERIKLLDFGIAKLTRGDGARHSTEVDSLIGTPSYMSPEQCRGASEVDTKTDSYALGILMYVMLTGRLPFDGVSSAEIMARQLFAIPTPILTLAPRVSVELSALVHQMLCKEPLIRPEMAAISAALRQITSFSSLDSVIAKHSPVNRRRTFASAFIGSVLALLAMSRFTPTRVPVASKPSAPQTITDITPPQSKGSEVDLKAAVQYPPLRLATAHVAQLARRRSGLPQLQRQMTQRF